MANTKFNVGDKVNIPATVSEIRVFENDFGEIVTLYRVCIDAIDVYVSIREDNINE